MSTGPTSFATANGAVPLNPRPTKPLPPKLPKVAMEKYEQEQLAQRNAGPTKQEIIDRFKYNQANAEIQSGKYTKKAQKDEEQQSFFRPNAKEDEDKKSMYCFDTVFAVIYLILAMLGVFYGGFKTKPIPIITLKWSEVNTTNNTIEYSDGTKYTSPIGDSVANRVGAGVLPLVVAGIIMLISFLSFTMHCCLMTNQDDPPTPEEKNSKCRQFVKIYRSYSYLLSYMLTILVLSVLVGHITVIELISQCTVALAAIGFYGVGFMLSKSKKTALKNKEKFVDKTEETEIEDKDGKKVRVVTVTYFVHLNEVSYEFIYIIIWIGLFFEFINWILLFVALDGYQKPEVPWLVGLGLAFYTSIFLIEVWLNIHNPYCTRCSARIEDGINNITRDGSKKELKRSWRYIIATIHLVYNSILFGLVWGASA